MADESRDGPREEVATRDDPLGGEEGDVSRRALRFDDSADLSRHADLNPIPSLLAGCGALVVVESSCRALMFSSS